MIMEDTMQVTTIDTDALIKKIMQLPPQEAEKIFYKVQEKTSKEKSKALRDAINEYKKYVGVCFKIPFNPMHGMFPKMYLYHKIVSEYSPFRKNFSALCFTEYPFYWYEYQSHLMPSQGDFIFGEYNFDGIFIRSVPNCVFSVKNIEIISEKEYNEAMNLYVARLQEMKWVPNHYRFGGKLPQDPDWETKEDE